MDAAGGIDVLVRIADRIIYFLPNGPMPQRRPANSW
jgi:hypothetical protein